MTPRLLTAGLVAAYLSIPVAAAKRMTIGRTQIDGRVRWDRVAIDAHLDGTPAPGVLLAANANETEADAALERFLEAQRHAAWAP
jgi:hypothetical protein